MADKRASRRFCSWHTVETYFIPDMSGCDGPLVFCVWASGEICQTWTNEGTLLTAPPPLLLPKWFYVLNYGREVTRRVPAAGATACLLVWSRDCLITVLPPRPPWQRLVALGMIGRSVLLAQAVWQGRIQTSLRKLTLRLGRPQQARGWGGKCFFHERSCCCNRRRLIVVREGQ